MALTPVRPLNFAQQTSPLPQSEPERHERAAVPPGHIPVAAHVPPPMLLTQHCWLEKSQPQSAAIPLPEPDDVPVVMLPVPLDVLVLTPLPDEVIVIPLPLPLRPGFVPVLALDPLLVAPLPLPEPDGSPFVPTVCPPHAATAKSDHITLFASLMKASTRTKRALPHADLDRSGPRAERGSLKMPREVTKS